MDISLISKNDQHPIPHYNVKLLTSGRDGKITKINSDGNCFEQTYVSKGLRYGDLVDFWPKNVLEISGSQRTLPRTFSLKN